MKKKLLITLGCSWTEGYGCYDETTIPDKVKKNQKVSDWKQLTDIQENNFDRFHEYGWPVLLAKKLGYHKLINMGFGGSSTSGQLKRYYDSYYNEKFEDYDVTIIWFLTHPTRFSFYSQCAIYDIMPGVRELNNINHVEQSDFSQKYLEYIHDWQIDTTLEQLFHIKSMEQLCENRNFKLLLTHSDIKSDALLKYYHDSSNYLNPIPQSILYSLNPYKEQSYLCNHPNEKGYSKIAKEMYRLITKHHHTIINRNGDPELEWEWTGGNRMSWFPPNDVTMEDLIGADYIHQRLEKAKNKRYLL